MSDSLRPHGIYSPWNSPGQNTGMGSLSLLQGIFPTQELNPGLPHCRQVLYQLSHKGSPRILKWVAYSCSSRSSWPRDRTRVSCVIGKFFTNRAVREALIDNKDTDYKDTERWMCIYAHRERTQASCILVLGFLRRSILQNPIKL